MNGPEVCLPEGICLKCILLLLATGTETDIMAKEIAKIEPPYVYDTMAEVLNMEISLPSDATRGHLFFRFEFEDGSVMDSQDFKVYQN